MMTTQNTDKIMTGARLWAEYLQEPDRHPNLPNCSYAGYQCGDHAFPRFPVIVNVRDFGACGDGAHDDTAAIQSAINAGGKRNGAVVLAPAGHYRLDGMLHIAHDNLTLRGEGEDTVFDFTRPLRDVVGSGKFSDGPATAWSWCGGLIWVGPAWEACSAASGDVDAANGGAPGYPRELWSQGAAIGAVLNARRGDRHLSVIPDKGTNPITEPGDMLLMTWDNDENDTLLHTMAGHARMRDYPWHTPPYAMPNIHRFRWTWVVEAESIANNTLSLRQPLRLDIRPEWKVRIYRLGPHLRNVGVEHLRLILPPHAQQAHCQDHGYNGVYFNRCVHGWADGVTVVNADGGVHLSACKNVTVRRLHLSGDIQHHSVTTRVFSHDNRIEDFVVDAHVMHGLNVEGFSSGNVWRRGVMRHGTFDSHRGMSFDMMHTDITLTNDGRFGGNAHAGPFLGAHCVRWNIRLVPGEINRNPMSRSLRPDALPPTDPIHTPSGRIVYHPDLISDGALVGIQGVDPCLEPADGTVIEHRQTLMAPGDKNCRIADHNRIPDPPDLFEAQIRYRQRKREATSA